ncbi:MAG: hypothetical protein LIP77_05120 [Planctomycetes bacterium]|nr:hypothetical protein [Planctomycetota bacterium]
MMARKLAGFFAFLGIMVYLANWLYSSFHPDRGGTMAMSAERAWEVGIYLAAAFFLLGLFVSTLGIALVQETLAETRSRDMERKFRAKTTYDRIVNLSMDPAEAALGEEGAGAPEPVATDEEEE